MSDQSNALTSDEVNYLGLILEIVETRNWYALAFTLKNHTRLFESFARSLARTDELNGMTILHCVLRFDPPIEIIKALLDLVPDQIAQSDCLGRLPLHVATGCRCSAPAVRLLVDRHPDGCLARDQDGKTPLILACDADCELFEGHSGVRARSPPSLDVVRVLVRCVGCVPLEDSDGMSALEHAILSEADLRVVKMLQYLERRLGEGESAKRRRREGDAPGTDGSTTSTTDDVPAAVFVGTRADRPPTAETPRRVSREELCEGASPAKRRRSSYVDMRIASMHAVKEECCAFVE